MNSMSASSSSDIYSPRPFCRGHVPKEIVLSLSKYFNLLECSELGEQVHSSASTSFSGSWEAEDIFVRIRPISAARQGEEPWKKYGLEHLQEGIKKIMDHRESAANFFHPSFLDLWGEDPELLSDQFDVSHYLQNISEAKHSTQLQKSHINDTKTAFLTWYDRQLKATDRRLTQIFYMKWELGERPVKVKEDNVKDEMAIFRKIQFEHEAFYMFQTKQHTLTFNQRYLFLKDLSLKFAQYENMLLERLRERVTLSKAESPKEILELAHYLEGYCSLAPSRTVEIFRSFIMLVDVMKKILSVSYLLQRLSNTVERAQPLMKFLSQDGDFWKVSSRLTKSLADFVKDYLACSAVKPRLPGLGPSDHDSVHKGDEKQENLYIHKLDEKQESLYHIVLAPGHKQQPAVHAVPSPPVFPPSKDQSRHVHRNQRSPHHNNLAYSSESAEGRRLPLFCPRHQPRPSLMTYVRRPSPSTSPIIQKRKHCDTDREVSSISKKTRKRRKVKRKVVRFRKKSGYKAWMPCHVTTATAEENSDSENDSATMTVVSRNDWSTAISRMLNIAARNCRCGCLITVVGELLKAFGPFSIELLQTTDLSQRLIILTQNFKICVRASTPFCKLFKSLKEGGEQTNHPTISWSLPTTQADLPLCTYFNKTSDEE